MKKSRWVILGVLVLLVLAGAWFYWFKSTSRQKSLALSHRIPQASFVAHISALELGRFLLSGGPMKLDSIPADWLRIMRPPQEIGVDLFTDPWVFGDSSQLAFAFALSDPSAFRVYVQTVLPQFYTLDIDSSDDYFHCTSSSVSWQIAWNEQGHALYTRAWDSSTKDADMVQAFFSTEDSLSKPWISEEILAQVQVNDPDRLPWFLGWLDTGLYSFELTKNSLFVNAPDRDKPKDNKSISITWVDDGSGWLTQALTHLKLNELFNKLQVTPAVLEQQTALSFTLDSTYTHLEKFTTYRYDDNFNKVAVEKGKATDRLDWQMRSRFTTNAAVSGLEQKWKNLGTLTNGELHLDKLVIPYFSKDNVMVCRSAGTEEAVVADFHENTGSTRVAINLAKLESSLNKCSISVPPRYELPFKLVRYIYWENNAGFIEFNAEEGSPLSSMVRLAFDMGKERS